MSTEKADDNYISTWGYKTRQVKRKTRLKDIWPIGQTKKVRFSREAWKQAIN